MLPNFGASESEDEEWVLCSTVEGQEYDMETGRLLHGDKGDAEEPRLEVWDCLDQGGFVWFFFGDATMPLDKRPPIPHMEELSLPGARINQPALHASSTVANERVHHAIAAGTTLSAKTGSARAGWSSVYEEVRIQANHWTVVENVIDMAHVPYVHKGTVGDHAAFVDIVIDRTPTSLDFEFPIQSHTKEGEEAAFNMDALASMCLPCTSFIRFAGPKNVKFVTINSVVPIDEETTIIRFCSMRNIVPTSMFNTTIIGYDLALLLLSCPSRTCTLSCLGVSLPYASCHAHHALPPSHPPERPRAAAGGRFL